jgi:predicted membrane channel-forming protein YqfA (hemolysin III family)
MGLTALSFSRGPYSSWEQELGYRYYSIGFLLAGAVLPAIALLSVARRWAWTSAVLVVWMIAVFAVFLRYIMGAGGGV